MRWSEEIALIALSDPPERTDANGFPVPKVEVQTEAYADMKSVGASEFYRAAQAGISAELKFDVRALEYDGQTIVEYPVGSGRRYRVIRSYIHGNGEIVELTLTDLPEAQKEAVIADGETDGNGV